MEQGIIEVAPKEPDRKHEHYNPHKPVVREQAESTKVRGINIVYDASAKVNEDNPSLTKVIGYSITKSS